MIKNIAGVYDILYTVFGEENIVIAGGYPRDLYLNTISPINEEFIVPKDIDIHVFSGTHTIGSRCIGKLLAELSKAGINYESYGVGSSEGVEVVHVLKVDDAIDIIIYEPSVRSINDVLATFDWNINQFYTSGTRIVKPDNLDKLRAVHPMTTAERASKATEKFKQYLEWS